MGFGNDSTGENNNVGGSGTEVEFDFFPFLRTYKDGRVERFIGNEVVSPCPDSDPSTGVFSKDVIISPTVSARLYLPAAAASAAAAKYPILVYYHGGAFCVESAFSPTYHSYLLSLVSQCGLIAVSVDYRLAPEAPLPAGYEDSWAALQWVASHAAAASGGPDPWLNDHADFSRLFLAGDSAGANICHWVAMRAGTEPLQNGVQIEGVVLAHPYFQGEERLSSEPMEKVWKDRMASTWLFVCPSSEKGLDDPWLNPAAEGAPSLAGLACKRVLVTIAEKDFLSPRGVFYCEKLKQSGWRGKVEFLVSKEEDHVFHLMKPSCDNAVEMMGLLTSFFADGGCGGGGE